MDDFNFESYHDDDEPYEMTPRGVLVAKACVTLFEAGWSHEEIATILGWEDDNGPSMVQMTVAIAFFLGHID